MIKTLLKTSLGFLLLLAMSFFVLNLLIPESKSQVKKGDLLQHENRTFNYIAIGDSLTEGVGDSTNQGGFVPILAKNLESQYNLKVTYRNYGISGNTSNQILARMLSEDVIQEQVKQSDLMTLTVGGNDVMAVIRKNFTNLKRSSFEKASLAYQDRLRQIIDLSKKENKHLSIYILGIYNPFYLNFPEMTEMQDVIDNWNQKTKEVTQEYDKVYFVPINDQLYKGANGEEAIIEQDGSQKTVINDVLFTGDHFHPNTIGYHIMSDNVMEAIKKHEKKLNN